MDKEEKIIRYEKIVERLRNISDKIDILETHLDDLKVLNEETLKINGSGVGRNNITSAYSYVDSASNVINNTIIPRLENKIENC